MYQSFESLPEDKKKRIIEACIEEFALNGYDKASTNSIIKKAGISKGILFHYFGSKKNMYLYLIDYVMAYFVTKFYNISTDPPADIFERLMQRGLIKLRMAYDDSLMYEFVFDAFINTPEELKPDVDQRYRKLYTENLSRFYKDLDTSNFREGVDPGKAIEIITIFMDGLMNKYLSIYKNRRADETLGEMDKIVEECREYFDILKKGIYK